MKHRVWDERFIRWQSYPGRVLGCSLSDRGLEPVGGAQRSRGERRVLRARVTTLPSPGAEGSEVQAIGLDSCGNRLGKGFPHPLPALSPPSAPGVGPTVSSFQPVPFLCLNLQDRAAMVTTSSVGSRVLDL